jgi:hypothetical protein
LKNVSIFGIGLSKPDRWQGDSPTQEADQARQQWHVQFPGGH